MAGCHVFYNRPQAALALAAGPWWSVRRSRVADRSQAEVEPSIEFSRVPPAGDGSPEQVRSDRGPRQRGSGPATAIVLFALSGDVVGAALRPNEPFTAIQSDSTWKSSTHPGVRLCRAAGGFALSSAADRERAAGKRRPGAGRCHRRGVAAERPSEDASVQRIPVGDA